MSALSLQKQLLRWLRTSNLLLLIYDFANTPLVIARCRFKKAAERCCNWKRTMSEKYPPVTLDTNKNARVFHCIDMLHLEQLNNARVNVPF
jgi:hypothetical protein